MVKISVIMCVSGLRRSTLTTRSVHSVLQQTRSADEIILICETKSLASKLSALLPKKVKVITSHGYGLSGARNTGIRVSKGDILAFMDDDAIAGRSWLESLCNPFHSPKVVAAGGMSMPVWRNRRPKWFPEELNWAIGCTYPGLNSRDETVIGSDMAFRREVFTHIDTFRTKLGMIHSALRGGEETELCLRIKTSLKDAHIVLVPEAKVYHFVDPSRERISYLIRRCFIYGKSSALIGRLYHRFLRKNENSFIKYIFLHSLLHYLRQGRLESLLQMFVIFVAFMSVMMGFIAYRFNV